MSTLQANGDADAYVKLDDDDDYDDDDHDHDHNDIDNDDDDDDVPGLTVFLTHSPWWQIMSAPQGVPSSAGPAL